MTLQTVIIRGVFSLACILLAACNDDSSQGDSEQEFRPATSYQSVLANGIYYVNDYPVDNKTSGAYVYVELSPINFEESVHYYEWDNDIQDWNEWWPEWLTNRLVYYKLTEYGWVYHNVEKPTHIEFDDYGNVIDREYGIESVIFVSQVIDLSGRPFTDVLFNRDSIAKDTYFSTEAKLYFVETMYREPAYIAHDPYMANASCLGGSESELTVIHTKQELLQCEAPAGSGDYGWMHGTYYQLALDSSVIFYEDSDETTRLEKHGVLADLHINGETIYTIEMPEEYKLRPNNIERAFTLIDGKIYTAIQLIPYTLREYPNSEPNRSLAPVNQAAFIDISNAYK